MAKPGDRLANWSSVLVSQFRVAPAACMAEPTTSRTAADVAAAERNPTAPMANATQRCMADCIKVSTWAAARLRIGGAFIRSMPSTVPKMKPTTRIVMPYPMRMRSAVLTFRTLPRCGILCQTCMPCQR